MIDLRNLTTPPEAIRAALDLQPHPEGGHYREAYRDVRADGGRGAATSILFLLAAGEWSHWHRVDAAETWLWQAGAPLLLGIAGRTAVTLGPDLAAGQLPQLTIPAKTWQEAASGGTWTLVSCVVAPAFEFAGFELAPPGWQPQNA